MELHIKLVINLKILIHLNQVLKHVPFCLDLVADGEEFVSEIEGDERIEVLDVHELPQHHIIIVVIPHVLVFGLTDIFYTAQVVPFDFHHFCESILDAADLVFEYMGNKDFTINLFALLWGS